jgi:hypothetical protein
MILFKLRVMKMTRRTIMVIVGGRIGNMSTSMRGVVIMRRNGTRRRILRRKRTMMTLTRMRPYHMVNSKP